MLRLTRGIGKQIVLFTLDGEITLYVLDVDDGAGRYGPQAVLGFDAPKSVRIMRKEVLERESVEKGKDAQALSGQGLVLRPRVDPD